MTESQRKAKREEQCKNCRYYKYRSGHPIAGYICENARSPYTMDWVDCGFSCEEWRGK